jgi:hypothetical protein
MSMVTLFSCNDNEIGVHHFLESYEDKLTLITHSSFGLVIFKYSNDNSSIQFNDFEENGEPKMKFTINNTEFIPDMSKGTVHFICENGKTKTIEQYSFNKELNEQIWDEYKGDGKTANVTERGAFPVKKVLVELYDDDLIRSLENFCK